MGRWKFISIMAVSKHLDHTTNNQLQDSIAWEFYWHSSPIESSVLGAKIPEKSLKLSPSGD